jgi:hypothetical protein
MRTLATLHPTRKHGHKLGRLRRLQPASLLRRLRAATGGRPTHGWSHHGASPSSRVRKALPRVTGDAIGRLGGRRR